MFCANHSRSTNHHQTLHTGKNVLFTRPNYFPLAAECHLLDQTSFRQQRKGIYSTKRASASSGTPFARPNGLPPTAECHLLGQTGFRQQRKSICSTKCHLRYGNHPIFSLQRLFASATFAARSTIFKNACCENSFF